MGNDYLEAGKIVNTHGVRGEVRIIPWTDSPDFLAGIKRYFIDGEPFSVVAARIHKSFILASLEGIDVSHVGFAYHAGKELHFIHASSSQMEVVIEKKTLQEYTKTGIRVVRLN